MNSDAEAGCDQPWSRLGGRFCDSCHGMQEGHQEPAYNPFIRPPDEEELEEPDSPFEPQYSENGIPSSEDGDGYPGWDVEPPHSWFQTAGLFSGEAGDGPEHPEVGEYWDNSLAEERSISEEYDIFGTPDESPREPLLAIQDARDPAAVATRDRSDSSSEIRSVHSEEMRQVELRQAQGDADAQEPVNPELPEAQRWERNLNGSLLFKTPAGRSVHYPACQHVSGAKRSNRIQTFAGCTCTQSVRRGTTLHLDALNGLHASPDCPQVQLSVRGSHGTTSTVRSCQKMSFCSACWW